ncbi:MAG: Gfo/Idh/MocA family oxidoreductase [Candidatus Sumerlaeia bacterium]|nr:Gfo/Idh/MocA family oxidoreductase [Candidatus Sumerlaeia bacterium]
MNRRSLISRRTFLRTASASAAAAPLILTSCARTPVRPVKTFGPNDRITMGVIGCGIQSRHLISRFTNEPEVQILAVCDVDKTRREAAAAGIDKKYGKAPGYKGCAIYTDFRELLARDDIDAVIIATPDHWHAIIAIEACKSGKDIFCEKPLSLTVHEARQMVNAVRKYRRVFQTGSMQRSSEEFHKACTLVRNGRIGKIKEVIVNIGGTSVPCDLPTQPTPEGLDWNFWLGPAPLRGYHEELAPQGADYKVFPHWRNYREYSGGMMTDWGAHHFDIAQWGLGMDESGPIEISPPKGEQGKPGYVPLTYKYANGVVMMRNSEHEGQKINGVRFIGESGVIDVNRGFFKAAPESVAADWESCPIQLYKSRNHYGDFLDSMRSRKPPICDVEVGARSATVCHIGNIAWWTGLSLKWDPVKEVFYGSGSDEANKWLDRARRAPWKLPKV